MVVIVRGSIPATELALSHVLRSDLDVEIDVERIVQSGHETVMPLVWFRGMEKDKLESLLEADDSIESISQLADLGDEFLYRMEWVEQIILLLNMLTDAEATVLNAYGRGDRWNLRVMYPNREKFSENLDFSEQADLSFEIHSIRELDDEPVGRYGLTQSQYDTLIRAVDQGYFEIPREVSLEDLAADFGVSHQALSERLRRGLKSLVEDTLVIGNVDETEP
ncbi:helix-turn-helix domain-containing protein [Haladaptatus sp. DJG-WS-42]|uniref:helix-turn-helix domain-containing protein n=1 Tax=Haladaptatus sp. DJG-WS-42 TaxID=3120516 RepID=UPI0030CE74A2